jgi:hypothetical protein
MHRVIEPPLSGDRVWNLNLGVQKQNLEPVHKVHKAEMGGEGVGEPVEDWDEGAAVSTTLTGILGSGGGWGRWPRGRDRPMTVADLQLAPFYRGGGCVPWVAGIRVAAAEWHGPYGREIDSLV